MLDIFKSLNPFGPKIDPDLFRAFYIRTPEIIEVKWKKEGDYFIGRVSYEDCSFGTQGKTVEEFIDMVNEGIVISCNVSNEYIPLLRKARNYQPTPKILNELVVASNGATGTLSFKKKELATA